MQWTVDVTLSTAEPVKAAGPAPAQGAGSRGLEDLGAWLLRTAATSGALILGEEGNGRRTVLSKLLASADPDQRIVTVAGSTFAHGMDYGALMFLLSRLPDPDVSRPGLILDGLRNELHPAGTPGPTVVVVEGVRLLDRYSSMALAQLALRRDIVLLIVCTRAEDLRHDLAVLWAAHRLARVDVAPLSRQEVHRAIVKQLRAPVSRHAATFLWKECQGRSEVLGELVDTFVRDGRLSLLGDAWVLRRPRTSSARRAAVVPSGLSERARSVLSKAAGAGELMLEEAIALGGAAVVDELFAAGAAVYGQCPGTIRAGGADCTGLEGPDHHAHPDGDALGRARQTVERAAAHLREGRAARAACVVGPLLTAVATDASFWSRDRELAARVVATGARALTDSGRGADGIRWIERALETCASTPGSSVAEARLKVCAARIGLAGGDLGPALRLAGTATTAAAWLESESSNEEGICLSMAACVAEAWALAGRGREASGLAAWVIEDLAAAQSRGTLGLLMKNSELEHIGAAVLTVAAATSRWDIFRAWGTISDALAGASPDLDGMMTLCEGVLAHRAGEPEHALAVVTPSLRQFEADGRNDLAGAASALAACCLAETGRLTEAEALLSRQLETDIDSGLGWLVEYYAALAIARVHSGGAGAVRLSALAESVHGTGAHLVGAMAASLALALGAQSAGDRMAGCASKLDPDIGGAFLALAGAIRSGMPSDAGTALETLMPYGGRTLAELAFPEPLPPRDRRLLQRAQTTYRETFRANFSRSRSSTGPADHEWSDQLSVREREVAAHVVEGLTNQQISHLTGVSVRTVEGHLYQIYSKLGVKRRTELADLVGGHLGTRP